MKLVLGKGQRRNRRRALSHAHDEKRRRRLALVRAVVDNLIGSIAIEILKGKLSKLETPKSETETK